MSILHWTAWNTELILQLAFVAKFFLTLLYEITVLTVKEIVANKRRAVVDAATGQALQMQDDVPWKPSLFIMNNFVEWLKQLSKIIPRILDTQRNKNNIRDQCENDELVRSYDPIEADGTKTILISSCQIMHKSVSAYKWNVWREKCLVRNDIAYAVWV